MNTLLQDERVAQLVSLLEHVARLPEFAADGKYPMTGENITFALERLKNENSNASHPISYAELRRRIRTAGARI